MPGIDELLRADGERWRVEVDAWCTAADENAVGAGTDDVGRRRARPSWRLPPRRVLQWSGSLAGAAAAATVVVALIAHGGPASSGGGSGADSAVRADGGTQRSTAGSAGGAALPSARAGVAVAATPTAGCDPVTLDVAGPPGAGSPGAPLPVAAGQVVTVGGAHYGEPACGRRVAAGGVTLRLSTADGRTVTLLRIPQLATDGSFRVRVAIPATAASGPAGLADDRGHRVRLTVTPR